jgi:hypothetical protein
MTVTITRAPHPPYDHSMPIDRKIIITQLEPGLWETRPITDEERHTLRADSKAKTIIQRNKYLSDSDIYVLPDRWETYDDETKNKWTKFRQALRDITKQQGFPYDQKWPIHPLGKYS